MTDNALQLINLTKQFDRQLVLKGINVEVHRGEVIGLLGLNGAGKTTLLETALGFSVPTTGSSQVFGQDCLSMDGTTKARIGFVPQRDELLDGMSGTNYLALIADFYPRWNQALVQRLATEWAVPLTTRINKLSIGQRQKLSIISALGHEPDLLVLDEPVASLDPVARRQFLRELVDIASAQTRSIVFSTHIVTDLERVASRVWLMQDGALRLDASLDELKENVVRLHVPAGIPLPALLAPARVLHERGDGSGGRLLLVEHWHGPLNEDRPVALDAAIRVETLSLEDLFLELHA